MGGDKELHRSADNDGHTAQRTESPLTYGLPQLIWTNNIRPPLSEAAGVHPRCFTKAVGLF